MSRCLRDHNEYYPLQMSNHLWSHAIYWWVWESAGLCRHTPVVGLSHGYTPCLVSRDNFKGCTRQDVHLILPSWVVIQSPYLPNFMFLCQIYCVMGPGSWTLGFVFYVSSLFLLVFGKWFMFRFCSFLHSLWNFLLYFSWCYLLGPIQLTVCFLLVFFKSFSRGYLWVGFLYFLVSQYFVFSLLTCCCCCCFFIFYSCSFILLFLVLLLTGYSLCFHFVLLSVFPLHPSGPSVFLLCQVNTIPPC